MTPICTSAYSPYDEGKDTGPKPSVACKYFLPGSDTDTSALIDNSAFHNSLIGELFKCVGQKKDPYHARLRDHCPFLVRESARRFFGHDESITEEGVPASVYLLFVVPERICLTKLVLFV